MRKLRSLLTALILAQALAAQQPATVLAPGVISTAADEGPFALTPDGRSIYFTRFAAGAKAPRFFASHLRDGRWSEPKEIEGPEGAAVGPLSFSGDGKMLYFTHAPDAAGKSRLWAAERNGDGFRNARPLAGALEKWNGNQASPSAAPDGTLYFTSNAPDGRGGWDIYRSVLKDGQYQQPELLAGERHRRVNTELDEKNVTVSPDGNYLVFSSSEAPNGFGQSDLYIVDLRIPGNWGAWSWNLGPLVNGPGEETDPCISSDGKRLYFSRSGDIYEVNLEAARGAPAESAAWKSFGKTPQGHNWPQAVVADGLVYVYGGFVGGFGSPEAHSWFNRVDVFDPSAGTWSSLGPGPDGWAQATLVSFENRLFLFRRGGPGVAEYRPALKRWEVKPASNEFALNAVWPFQTRTVVLGRKAYTMLSWGGLRDFSYFAEYDFDTGVWTRKRTMPNPTPQLVAFGGRIYAFGGGRRGTQVIVYDPRTDEWSEAASTDMPRAESAPVAFKDEIWLIGGHGARARDTDGDISPTVARFNPRRNTWSHGPALPWLRAAAAAVVVNGRLLVIGGLRPDNAFTYAMPILEYAPR